MMSTPFDSRTVTPPSTPVLIGPYQAINTSDPSRRCWYYASSTGKPQGPFDEHQLSKAMRKGDLTRHSLVWNGELVSTWIELDHVPGLWDRLIHHKHRLHLEPVESNDTVICDASKSVDSEYNDEEEKEDKVVYSSDEEAEEKCAILAPLPLIGATVISAAAVRSGVKYYDSDSYFDEEEEELFDRFAQSGGSSSSASSSSGDTLADIGPDTGAADIGDSDYETYMDFDIDKQPMNKKKSQTLSVSIDMQSGGSMSGSLTAPHLSIKSPGLLIPISEVGADKSLSAFDLGEYSVTLSKSQADEESLIRELTDERTVVKDDTNRLLPNTLPRVNTSLQVLGSFSSETVISHALSPHSVRSSSSMPSQFPFSDCDTPHGSGFFFTPTQTPSHHCTATSSHRE